MLWDHDVWRQRNCRPACAWAGLDSARGVKFMAAAVESSAKNGAWVDVRLTF